MKGLTAGQLILAVLAGGCVPGGVAPTRAPDLLIRHVTVIDATGRPSARNLAISVVGERIVAIVPDGQIAADSRTRVIDGKGRYLVPGLWDMHVHVLGYEELSFPLFLANGVTTIREMGGNLQVTSRMRREAFDGKLPGPRMLIAGPRLNGEGMVRDLAGTIREGMAIGVADAETAARVVDSLAQGGVNFIKVHAALPRDAYFATLAAARRHGLTVVGHVPNGVTLHEAIDAGQRTIEHASGLEFANAPRGAALTAAVAGRIQRYQDSAGPNARPAALTRILMAASDSATAEWDAGTARAFARYVADRRVWIDPTLVTYQLFLRAGDPSLWDLPERKYIPRALKDFDEIPAPAVPLTTAELERGRQRWEDARRSFRALVAEHARFLAGTDVPVGPLVPGFSLHREFQLLREIGLTPSEVLEAATRNAAEAAGLLRESGTIEVGKAADLLLLDADPLADVANLSRIRTVILRGRVFTREILDAMLEGAEADARRP